MRQNEIDQFIESSKMLHSQNNDVLLPKKNQQEKLDLTCKNFDYLCYINRKGNRKQRLSFVFFYAKNKQYPLVRLDVLGKPHTNPLHSHYRPGESIDCPHIHIAEEGFGTSIAYTLDDLVHLKGDECFNFASPKALVVDQIIDVITRDFLLFLNTANINNLNFKYEEEQLELFN